MASLPLSVLDVQATFDQAKITRVSANVEVRAKSGSDTDEELRIVLAVELEQTIESVSDIFVNPNSTTANQLTGTVRGGPIVTISFDSAYWQGSTFKLTRDELAGIGDDGSTQAVLSQTWVATTDWSDAPWNPA